MSDRNLARRNGMVLGVALAIVVGMVGMSFAAVPLYDLFCRVTGFGGTTQVAADGQASGEVLDRTIRVRFVADVDRELPWEFGAETNEVEVRIGEPTQIDYWAESVADAPTAGTAIYNVAPAKAGLYFVKVQCFCFDEQVLMPGQQVDMPVYFYVDPAMADDPNLDDVRVITLSYRFFPTDSDALDEAIEDYYRSVEEATAAAPTSPANDEDTAAGG
jgi:cytochrome c oxidase assembly protein subunit 11